MKVADNKEKIKASLEALNLKNRFNNEVTSELKEIAGLINENNTKRHRNRNCIAKNIPDKICITSDRPATIGFDFVALLLSGVLKLIYPALVALAIFNIIGHFFSYF